MLVRIAAFVLIAVLAFGPVPVLAQAAGPDAVLIVDQEKLFSQSAFGKRVATELQERSVALGADNRRIETELRAEEQTLTDERATMSPEDFRAKADAFDEKVQRVRGERAATQAEIEAFRQQEQDRFSQQIGAVLASIMEERQASILLDKRSVLLAAKTVDITDEAIERVNVALGDGAATPTPPPP